MLAPTGTISFLMDCDTTGVEPDFSLVKTKRLVGGGEITIVNGTVPVALQRLGYAPHEVDQIVAHINDKNTVVGAPFIKPEHLDDLRLLDRRARDRLHGPRQDDGRRAAVHLGCDLEDGEHARDGRRSTTSRSVYLDSWKLGVKALAIYRDNCKVAQPLSASRPSSCTSRCAGRCRSSARRSAASSRSASTRATSTSASSPTATPGDVFVDIAKEGTTLAGLMNAFMISVSLGLQYGVPLEVYVSKFSHMRFEPSGLTNDPDIRVAKSLVDYIFRWLGKKFLDADQQAELGIMSAEVRARLQGQYAAATPTADGSDYAASAPAPELGRGATAPRSRRASARSSTPGRTPRSARSAAAARCAPARATRAATAATTRGCG